MVTNITAMNGISWESYEFKIINFADGENMEGIILCIFLKSFQSL